MEDEIERLNLEILQLKGNKDHSNYSMEGVEDSDIIKKRSK